MSKLFGAHFLAVAGALVIVCLAAAPVARADPVVRARVEWSTDSDIDLHVYDQAGDHAYYGYRNAIPSGELSPDVIPSPGDTSAHEELYSDSAGNTPLGLCVHYYGS